MRRRARRRARLVARLVAAALRAGLRSVVGVAEDAAKGHDGRRRARSTTQMHGARALGVVRVTVVLRRRRSRRRFSRKTRCAARSRPPSRGARRPRAACRSSPSRTHRRHRRRRTACRTVRGVLRAARRADLSRRSTRLHHRQRAELGRFWSADSSTPRRRASPPRPTEAALARSYDALKAVDPDDRRHRPRPLAARQRPAGARRRNPSISPVRFIQRSALPTAQAAGHCRSWTTSRFHPVSRTRCHADAPEKGLLVAERRRAEPRPAPAGVLGRVPRHGPADVRGERHAAATAGAVRPWILDEAGWQTKTQNAVGYIGTENVPDGRRGRPGAAPRAVVRPFRLRPARRRAPLLPLGRRDRPRSLPDRRVRADDTGQARRRTR